MGFFVETAQQLKKAFTPKLDWREIGDSVKGSFKHGERAVLIKDRDLEELKSRYKNLRITAIATLIFLSIAFISILVAPNFKDFFYSLLATTLFSMFYFRYSFMLWVCRHTYLNNTDISARVEVTASQFWYAIFSNPKSILPQAFPDNRPEKGASK